MSSIGTTTFSSRLEFLVTAGANDEFFGPMTVYASNLYFLDSTTTNTFTTRYNSTNVLNLGGHINFQITGVFGTAGSPTQTLGTFTNLIADTSSQINGSSFTNNTQIFLNSVNSNGIVHAVTAALPVEYLPKTAAFYIANGAAANTNGILGGWAVSGAAGWATIGAGGLIAPLASYTPDTAANSGWTASSTSSANNTTLDGATNNQNDVVSAGSAANSLRFVSLNTSTTNGANLNQTVTLSGTNVISSGGIPGQAGQRRNRIRATFTIAGGNLTSGATALPT